MAAAMGRSLALTLFIAGMIALIVAVDFAFFRYRFLERLLANFGIVLLFVAFYLRFFRRG